MYWEAGGLVSTRAGGLKDQADPADRAIGALDGCRTPDRCAEGPGASRARPLVIASSDVAVVGDCADGGEGGPAAAADGFGSDDRGGCCAVGGVPVELAVGVNAVDDAAAGGEDALVVLPAGA